MPKPFIPFSATITKDIFNIRKKPKYKLGRKKPPAVIKLKAQKSPKSFLSEEAKKFEAADKAARKKFGEGVSYLPGMNVKSTQRLTAESYAGQVEERMFSRTFFKERKASRLRTAGGIKGKKLKIKTPTAPSTRQQVAGIFKGSSLPKSKASLRLAKGKGAMGAYNIADTKAKTSFSKIVEKYTSQTKASSFKIRDKATPKKNIRPEILKDMGVDDRKVSAGTSLNFRKYDRKNKGLKFTTKRTTNYEDYLETPKFDIFKKRKKK